MSATSLSVLAQTLHSLPDPRSKQGVSHPYHGMLALVFIGLLAEMPYFAILPEKFSNFSDLTKCETCRSHAKN